jgi:hypothetical protein
MYTDYQTFEELNTAPNYLLIGASAIYNLRATRPQLMRVEPDPLPEDDTKPFRSHDKARTYKSQYVGVTTHNNRYVAVWGRKEAPIRCGVHSLDAAGERAAACDRAQALGRDYLERRDGNHEPV